MHNLQPFPDSIDIAIVGGGATGLGAAVEAATRGHSVLLIEQADFASGTSSRSTKLIHGGVRYLKQGNVSLVLEALREREWLYRNAPHLVHPLPLVIPSYHGWELPFYGVGLKLYDLLAGKQNQFPSRLLSKAQVQQCLPSLVSKTLSGGVLYYDGQFDDAALAVCLARTAQKHGAVVRNYVRCERLLLENGKVVGVVATDLTNRATVEVRAKCVVNATGVFVDTLRSGAPPLVQVSQGVHLVLPRRFLPGDTALMIPRTEDGRVLFVIPWQGVVLLGTTDTPVAHASLEPRALPDEVVYLLRHAAHYLQETPTEADVLSVFAGLRPLVKRRGESRTASLSRDHHIERAESGLLTITGGKWTTYRKMGEDVVNHAEAVAGLTHATSRTADLVLDAPTIPTDGPLLHPQLPYTHAELVWHAKNGQVQTLEDLLARRTRALLLDARASAEAAADAAALIAPTLGWSPANCQEQVASYRTLAQGYCL